MKINELTLINYATSADTPADKEGWLWKRGEVNKAFQVCQCYKQKNGAKQARILASFTALLSKLQKMPFKIPL